MDKEVARIEQQLNSAMALLHELKNKELEISSGIGGKTSFDEAKSEIFNQCQSQILKQKDEMVRQMHLAIDSFDKDFEKNTKEAISSLGKDEIVKGSRSGIFSQKVHKTRSSLLIKMHRNENVRTVYHIFIAIMLVMCLEEMLHTYFKTGYLIDVSLFAYVFGDYQYVFMFWFVMAGFSYLIIPLVQVIHFKKISCYVWIPVYCVMILTLYVFSCWFCLYMKLPMASGLIVTCEMVRMSLKMHSYLREKLLFGNGENQWAKFIPESLKNKGVTIESLNIPDIKIEDLQSEYCKFTYFFFAPTLIYRDYYPRTNYSDRSSRIISSLLNVLGTIFYTFIIFQRYCFPYFQESWKEEYNFRFVLISWFKVMIPGTMLLILLFFGMLHSWFNLWAEILRFGDKEFYTDWWNVSNFADYYRRWNIVVHEWLFHYVYQDILRFTRGKSSQLFCFFMVFIISALIHELILAISMRFFYPILLVMFGGPGVIYTFFSRKDARLLNVFVWSMFFVGNGLLVVFYSWEHFARKSLDLSEKYGWKAFFIPHSWGYK
jgi:sterol O-acyltransferase